MGFRLINPPAPVEPITLAEAKAILRVTHNDDDTMIQTYISSAREWVERRIQKKLAVQTWELTLDSFPNGEILLPVNPVINITSVKYDDAQGNEVTMAANTYSLDNTSEDHWLFTSSGWPTAGGMFNAVRIRFVAGLADPATVPFPVRAAIYLKLKELYDGEKADEAIHSLLTNYYKMVA